MAAIGAGTVTGFFLFDVAETIDLQAAQRLLTGAAPAQVASRAPLPSYIQYAHPPLAIDGAAVDRRNVGELLVRFKMFDYGVISVALSGAIPDTWDRLLVEGLRWHDDGGLLTEAERCCRSLIDRIGPALMQPRAQFLSEDYAVFAVAANSEATTAEDLLAAHGAEIAQLLRGEREPLSTQEREEVLRHRLSYLAGDLVVATWSAAFIYDTEANVPATQDILEFANSQLLQFRYYDRLLDDELARIYADLQQPRWGHSWFGRRYTRAARQVHALFIDVNELTDRTENALKIAGDVFTARLYTLTAARLGLDHWKGNVQEKLKTLDDIYRFAVEQTAMTRGELLELMIVAILVLELVLFFAGIMR